MNSATNERRETRNEKRTFLVSRLSFLVLFAIATQVHASRLSDLAGSMQPGDWKVLDQDGDASGYGASFTASGAGIGGIYTYSSRAAYDPIRRRVYHFASGHNLDTVTPDILNSIMKFNVYDINTNTWTRIPNPIYYTTMANALAVGNTHAYRLETIANGQFFRAWPGSYTVYRCDINKDNVLDIGGANCPGTYPAAGTTGPNGINQYGSIDYFPERNSLIFIPTDYTGRILENPLGTSNWNTLATVPDPNTVGGLGVSVAYHPAAKVIVFGGGGGQTYTHAWYKLDAAGAITRLDDFPVDTGADNFTRFVADPLSSKFILIQPNDIAAPTGYAFYELDVTQPAGSQWSRRPDLEAAVPQLHGGSDNLTESTVALPIPEYGVIMFLTPDKVRLYKHSAGTGIPVPPPPPPQSPPPPGGNPPPPPPSTLTFAQKCGGSGVLACWSFDNTSELRYGWDRSNSALNSAMTAMGEPYYPGPSNSRLAGEANTFAWRVDEIPVIDAATYKDGAGSLKFTIPSQSGEGNSEFVDNIDKVLGTPNAYVAPGSPLGNTYYLQYQLRVNDVMLNTPYHVAVAKWAGAFSTSGAGSRQLIRASVDPYGQTPTLFDSQWVGRLMEVGPDPNGNGTANFVYGVYTVESVQDGSHLTLKTSPTPTGAGVRGSGTVGSPAWINFWHGTLSTSGAGSDILIAPADNPFPPEIVGDNFQIGITFPNHNNNFDDGVYPVIAFIDSTHIRLGSSPTPSGAGTSGWGNTQGLANGWKTNINFGNAPNGRSSGIMEVTMQNSYQLGLSQMYGQQGLDGYPVNYTVPFQPNQWQEITQRIIVGGVNTPDSDVTWWVDGVQAGHTSSAKIKWGPNGDGDGIGQLMLTPFHTNKDPTQVTATGYMWFDDLITSTQPIPMATGSTPPPPGSPPPPGNPPPPVTKLTLNLPATLPLTATISAQVPASWTVTRFDWVFTAGGQNSGVPEQRVTAEAGSGSSINRYHSPPSRSPAATGNPPSRFSAGTAGSLSTSGANASLASLNLTPGPYTITVTAFNGSTQLGSASATTTLVQSDLSAVKVYPNPWRKDKHEGKKVTFNNLPSGSTIKIFTISGHEVKSLGESGGQAQWDLTNDSGDKVASGIYMYLIAVGDAGNAGGQMMRGKIAVIK